MNHRTILIIVSLFSPWIADPVFPGQNDSPVPNRAQDKRTSVPTNEKIRKSLENIRDIYQKDFERADTPAKKSRLAEDILKTALATRNDIPSRYVLMRLSKDIAITAGNLDATQKAVDKMLTEFQLDPLELKCKSIVSLGEKIKSNEFSTLVEWSWEVAVDAIQSDQYEKVRVTAESLAKSAAKIRDTEARKNAQQIRDRIVNLESAYNSASDALQKIKTDAGDPSSQLVAGRFLCFHKLDWKRGLVHLTKSNHPNLKKLANDELKRGMKPGQIFELATKWWEAADEFEKAGKKWQPGEIAAMRIRAAHHFSRIEASIDGLRKVTAKARISEANETAVQLFGNSSLWSVASVGTNEDQPEVTSPDPTGLQGVSEYTLPSTFDDVVFAGNGRYMVFLFSSISKAGLFDVSKGRIIGFIPLENPDARITADASSVYVALRNSNTIQKWSLENLKKRATATLPFKKPVEWIAAGCSSNGPVYVSAEGEPGIFLSASRMRPIPVRIIDHVYQRTDATIPTAAADGRVRVSSDGRVFTIWGTRSSPGGFRSLVLSGNILNLYYKHETMGYLAPSADGTLIHTAKGIYTYETIPFSGNHEARSESFSVPAISQNFSIRLPRNDDREALKQKTSSVTVHVAGQERALVKLKDIRIRPGEDKDFHNHDRLTIDKRISFLPGQQMIITLPENNKTVIRHPANLEKELHDAGVDYFFVQSIPVLRAIRGSTYRYQIRVKSRSGGIEFKLGSGPKGMRVSKSGMVTWKTNQRSNSESVIVTITNSSGNELSHTFRIEIE